MKTQTLSSVRKICPMKKCTDKITKLIQSSGMLYQYQLFYKHPKLNNCSVPAARKRPMYVNRTINRQLIVFRWLVSSYRANLKKVGTSFYPISISKAEWTFVQNCSHGPYLLSPANLANSYTFAIPGLFWGFPLRRLP